VRGGQMAQDFLEHNVSLLQHVIIPETDDSIALRLEAGRSSGVAGNLPGMLSPIQLDYLLLL